MLLLPDAAERIPQRAELDLVKKYCPEHVDHFSARYRNARMFAVHWRIACHGGHRPATNTLCDYLALIKHEVREGAGSGRAGQTIRIMRTAVEKGLGPAKIT